MRPEAAGSERARPGSSLTGSRAPVPVNGITARPLEVGHQRRCTGIAGWETGRLRTGITVVPELCIPSRLAPTGAAPAVTVARSRLRRSGTRTRGPMTGMDLGRGGTTNRRLRGMNRSLNRVRPNSGITVPPTAATVVPRSKHAACDPQNRAWRRANGKPEHGAKNGSHPTTAWGTNSVTLTNEHPRQEEYSGDSGVASCSAYEGGATV